MIPESRFSARWCRLRLVGGTAIGTDWRPFASLRLASSSNGSMFNLFNLFNLEAR
jgi:hypothetical protein